MMTTTTTTTTTDTTAITTNQPVTLTIINPEDNAIIAQWQDTAYLFSTSILTQDASHVSDPQLSIIAHLPQEAIADADAWNPDLLVTICTALHIHLLNQMNAIPTPTQSVNKTVAYSDMTAQDAADLRAAVWHTDRTVNDRTEVTFPVNVPVEEDATTQQERATLRSLIDEVVMLASFFKIAIGHRYLLQNSAFQPTSSSHPTEIPA